MYGPTQSKSRLESSTEVIVDNESADQWEQPSIAQFQSDCVVAQLQGEALSLTQAASTAEPYFSGTGLPYSSTTLDVPYVKKVNGAGICWAAATASIIRYLTSFTSVTALNVYNTVLTGLGTMSGDDEAILYGLKAYGVSYYTYVSGSLPFQTVVNQIKAGYPIYIGINGEISNDERAYHGVVLCGYLSESDGTSYYQIVDSNYNKEIWITVNRTSNAFSYASSDGITYTGWHRSVYSTRVS